MSHSLLESLNWDPWVQLKNLDMVGFYELSQRLEVNHSGAGWTMIPAGELNVVDVEACEGRGHGFQVECVIDESQVLLDLSVASVVPVADVWVGGPALEEQMEIAFEWDFLHRLAIFDAEHQPSGSCLIGDSAQHFICELYILLLFVLSFTFGLLAEFGVFWRFLEAFPDHVDEFVGVVLHIDAAHVKDDQFCLEAFGCFQGFEGMPVGIFPLSGISGSKFIEVWSGVIYADREGAEVVEGGDFDFAGFDGGDDAGEEADTDTVAEFSEFETEFSNFAEHGPAIGMSA